MGYISSVYDQIAFAFSIVGLTLVVPTVFIFKQYNRFLDHLQVIFLFSVMLSPNYETFGSHLDDSWAKFIPNFLKFCTSGDLVCELGFALSWTISLIGVILISLLVVTLVKCGKPEFRFELVYSFFKGFFKWTYLPLVYYSLIYLILDIKNGTRTNLISSIVILGWTIVFPFAQLIFYKVIQEETNNIWIKWFQFFGYLRQFSIVLVLVLAQYVETNTIIAKYFVYGVLIMYYSIYMFKGVYIHQVIERFMFGIQEAIMISIYAFYLFDLPHLSNYDFDFFGLSIILIFQVTMIVVRLVLRLAYGKKDNATIVIRKRNSEKAKLTPGTSSSSQQKVQDQNIGNDSTNAIIIIKKDTAVKRRFKQIEIENLVETTDSRPQSMKKRTSKNRD